MAIRFGFISTYPPTPCGLATFTAALSSALTDSGGDTVVARLLDSPERRAGSEVVANLMTGDLARSTTVVQRLNNCDVVIVQHEFGIYGGQDGADVLMLIAEITVPTVVVLHTVPAEPTRRQRVILEALVACAGAVVTLTSTARDRLAAGYDVDPDKISVIPHGAPEPSSASLGAVFRSGQPMVLTWGLLGPGKGIEWGVEALALLRDLHPAPRYVVAGQTHPKVVERDGEAYRDSLGRLIQARRLTGEVTLDGRYRDTTSLSELIASSDVVLLPYDSVDQVSSGVLIEAVAAGKPVIATAFPHAVELLANGAGIVVPHRNPAALAAALRTVLTRKDVAATMSRAASAAAPGLRWSAVADEYQRLARQLAGDAVAGVAAVSIA